MISQLEREPLWTDAKMLQQSLNLPFGLFELYSTMLSGIEASHRDSAMTILTWAAYATRPLRVSELAEAIGSERSSETSTQDALAAIKSLLGSCKDLLVVTEAVIDRHDFDYHGHSMQTVYVVLAHHSVRDYLFEAGSNSSLVTNTVVRAMNPHTVIASFCIEYLHGHDVSPHNTGSANDLTYPLRDYATRNWRYHLDMAQRSRNSNMAQRLDELELMAESIPTNDQTTQPVVQSPTRALTFGALQHDVESGPSRQQVQTRPSDTLVRTGNSNSVSQLVRCFTTPLPKILQRSSHCCLLRSC